MTQNSRLKFRSCLILRLLVRQFSAFLAIARRVRYFAWLLTTMISVLRGIKTLKIVKTSKRLQTMKMLLAIALGSASTAACTDDLQHDPFEISTSKRLSPISTNATSQLQALTNVAPLKSEKADLVRDVYLLLGAISAEQKGEYKRAANLYFSALKIAKGRFGEAALNGWVLNYARSLERKTKGLFISRILLDVAQQGTISPYMQENKITTIKKMNSIVTRIAAKYTIIDAPKPMKQQFPPPPKRKGIPAKDPLLRKTVSAYCQGSGEHGYQWQAWIDGLPKSVKKYWLGFVAACKHNPARSSEKLDSALQMFAASKNHQNLQVWAAKKIVKFRRSSGSRVSSAKAYLTLMNAWSKKNISAKKMDMKPKEFLLERINDTLWAARFRALAGDYQTARTFASRAQKLISKAFMKSHLIDHGFREKLSDFKAETYLILANRIAVEEKNISTAASQLLVATGIPNLSQTIKESLYWYAGFYQYLDGQLQSAVDKWEDLLKMTDSDSTKAQVYFWASKAYAQLGKKNRAQSLLGQLQAHHPLSYYSVVAAESSKLKPNLSWQVSFTRQDKAQERLNSRRYYHTVINEAPTAVAKLIQRSEILSKADLGKWAQFSVLDLDKPFKKYFDVGENLNAFLYISRLHFSVGNYLQSIIYTSALAKNHKNFWARHPEQLSIYFPRPFADTFERNSLETSIDKVLLMSITRQESAFNRTAVSGANAYGLMQLILPTASKYTDSSMISSAELRQELMKPEFNIAAGSRYLKDLKSHYRGFLPGVIGAYNAGEYAMDTWIDRRIAPSTLIWVELIPFGETRGYIRNVWRNMAIYKFIESY